MLSPYHNPNVKSNVLKIVKLLYSGSLSFWSYGFLRVVSRLSGVFPATSRQNQRKCKNFISLYSFLTPY